MTVPLFAGGGWSGSTARIGFVGVTGHMARTFIPSDAIIGVAGISDEFITRQSWHGTTALIRVSSEGGYFDGIGRAYGTTGIMVLGKSRSEVKVVKHRTAMMVGTGRTRSER